VKSNGISLLLYKDARVDMNILDETVGPLNWQKEYTRNNANCIVSIWDEDKGQWIRKEDTGTESFTEKEKGLASDSFKRACFNWGIGRELYTAPFVWIGAENCDIKPKADGKGYTCYDSFKVTDIGYDESRRINRLVIWNSKKREVVYEYGQKKAEPRKKIDHAGLKKTLKKHGIDEAYVLQSLGKETLESLTESEISMVNNNIPLIVERCKAWRQKQAS
jgi:hypothetical protein